MVARAIGEVGLHVVQRVVHPTHVPLEVEAQAAVLGWVGHERPRRGLLGNHRDIRVVLAHRGVALADKRDGFVVFLGAARVELLEARIVHAKVEVEHGSDAVHADAIGVVLVNPVEQVGDEEGAHLAAREVELVRAPVGVNLVLVEHLAVESGEALLVGAEAARYPVENHADAGLVAGVDKVLELLGLTVARGWGEVTRHLIAPRAVKRVLHDGHELDVRVAHGAHVVHQLDGEVVVRVELAALSGERIARAGIGAVRARVSLRLVAVTAPRAKVHLKDVERGLELVCLGALGEPCLVAPCIAGDVVRARGRTRCFLGKERVRVCLVEALAGVCLDHKLVERTHLDAGDKALPDIAGLGLGERIGPLIPVVELPNHVNALHLGRPDGKVEALGAVLVDGLVCAHLVVAAVPLALCQQVEVVVAQVQRTVTSLHARSSRVVCVPHGV